MSAASTAAPPASHADSHADASTAGASCVCLPSPGKPTPSRCAHHIAWRCCAARRRPTPRDACQQRSRPHSHRTACSSWRLVSSATCQQRGRPLPSRRPAAAGAPSAAQLVSSATCQQRGRPSPTRRPAAAGDLPADQRLGSHSAAPAAPMGAAATAASAAPGQHDSVPLNRTSNDGDAAAVRAAEQHSVVALRPSLLGPTQRPCSGGAWMPVAACAGLAGPAAAALACVVLAPRGRQAGLASTLTSNCPLHSANSLLTPLRLNPNHPTPTSNHTPSAQAMLVYSLFLSAPCRHPQTAPSSPISFVLQGRGGQRCRRPL